MNPTAERQPRIASIDILRGVIMLIMAIDHTRDYFHWPALRPGLTDPTNLDLTTPAIFMTRWITHFCAPVFVFLTGLSAYISGQRRTPKELSSFLIKRGFWLVIVELVIMTFVVTFNPYYNFFLLVTIWSIGWSMIVLGLLVRGSYKLVLAVGIILFLGHNILDYITLPKEGVASYMWSIWFTTSGRLLLLGDRAFLISYAILPWTAVMCLGYAIGVLYKRGADPVRRKKILLQLGIGLIVLFLVLRFINGYGDPSHWSQQKSGLFTFLSFLRATKYPASLVYCCMTLGPALVFLSLTENVNNRFSKFVSVYGSVPLFYYILHFFLIHVLCTIAFFATGHNMSEAVDPNSFIIFRPAFFGWSLWVVYGVWLTVILLLYYPCKWYSNYKKTHTHWWLSYL